MKTTRLTNGTGSNTRIFSSDSRSSGGARNRSCGTVIAAFQSDGSGLLCHHLGENSAHAVPDQDRVVERRVACARIDHVAHPQQRFTQPAGPRKGSAARSDRETPRTDNASR